MTQHSTPNQGAYRTRQGGREAGGFTLVEILTATAIMSIIISMVLTILTQVLNAWGRSSDALNLGGQARTALDLLSQDLQAAIFKRDGAQWFGCYSETLTDPPNLQPITESRLMFFAPTTIRETKDSLFNNIYGDVCAIEYRVGYADPFTGDASDPLNHPPTFTLHRVVVNAHSTLNGAISNNPIMGTSNLITLWNLIDAGNNPVTDSAVTSPAPLQIHGAKTYNSSFVDNLAQFDVRLYYYFQDPTTKKADGTNLAPIIVLPVSGYIPPVSGFTSSPAFPLLNAFFGGTKTSYPTSNLAVFSTTDTTTATVTGFQGLAYADVTVTLLNDDGVVAYQQNALGNYQTWYAFLQEFGSTYTTRIAFVNKPQ